MSRLTEVQINKSDFVPSQLTIEELPDGTCFEWQEHVYFVNRIGDALAFTIDGRFAMIRGNYVDEYPTRIFKKVTVTLE